MDKKIVLTGDIERSKDLKGPERRKVQERLQRLLDRLKNHDRDGIESPPTITLGDEFQAVYTHSNVLFNHTWHILADLYPVTVRFSLGIGVITTSVNRKQAIGMDGPAFHTARDGIEKLKESDFLYQVSEADREEDSILSLINGSLHLISREMRSWNKNRFTILFLLDEGVSVREIARNLQISESAVYKNRTDGSLDIIIEIKNSMVSLINNRLLI